MVYSELIIYFAIQSTFVMNQEKDYLKDLTEIRSMMEKSSRFISLSGLSGIFIGIFALIGAAIAYVLIGDFMEYYHATGRYDQDLNIHILELEWSLLIDAASVLILSLLFGYVFTARKAKRLGQKTWDKSSRQLLLNVAIPLIAGGIFCISLFYNNEGIGFVAPSMLIFYGLALVSGSKYTLDDIRYLGYLEIILGLISCFKIGYGLYFWAFGFGVLHIVYGISMYIKYEHKQ